MSLLIGAVAFDAAAAARSFDDASWLQSLFEQGRLQFYRACAQELLAHPLGETLESGETDKILEAGTRYPRLYGLMVNLYYQKWAVAADALIRDGDSAARMHLESLYGSIVRNAARALVAALFQPAANAEHVRQLLPAFRGKDRVDLILMSVGYFADPSHQPAGFVASTSLRQVSREFDRQWGLEAGNFRAAHALARGHGVKVAVVDSGIDPGHPVFVRTRFARHVGLLGRDGPPWSSEGSTFDSGGHGTMVASVIARYAPEAVITSYKKGDGDTTNNAPFPLLRATFMAASIYRAVHDGNHVVNISAGIAGDFPYLREACRYAYDSNVLVVTGAAYSLGRYLGLHITMPAQYPTTVSITAIERHNDGSLGYWDQTASDPTTTLAAPNGVFGAAPTYLDSQDRYVPSISAATPVAAAAAALAISVHPRMGTERPGEYVEAMRGLMIRTARPEALGVVGFTPETGYGLLDAERLVRAAAGEGAGG